MLSTNKALLGKRIYRGVSQSPNRGPVSGKGAQGYMKRELSKGRMSANTKGRDGKSDSRSGVAKNALNNHPNRNKNQGKGPNRGPNKGPKNPPQGSQNGGGPNANPAVEPPSTQPQVQINDQGLLELPYNQDYAQNVLDLTQKANDEQLALNAASGQQNLEYQTATRDASLAYDQLRRSTLNQNAARGTAFSSQYGNAVTGNSNAYANQVGGLEAQNTLFNEQTGIQRNAIQSNLQQQIANLTQGYANELGAEAGNLGFGTDPDETKHTGGKHGPRGYHGQHRNEGQNKKTHDAARRKREREARKKRQARHNDNKNGNKSKQDHRKGAKGSIKKQVKK